MITDGIKQADKAKVFDWLVGKLEDGTLEMLFKEDSSGDNDCDSVSSFEGLLGELEIASKSLSRKSSDNSIRMTMRDFNNVREEVCASYSQSGCMDDEASLQAERAYASIKATEQRNLIKPLHWLEDK